MHYSSFAILPQRSLTSFDLNSLHATGLCHMLRRLTSSLYILGLQ